MNPQVLPILAVSVACLGVICSIVVALRSRHALRALWASLESARREAAEREHIRITDLQAAYGQIAALRGGLPAPVRFTAQHGEDVFLVEHFGFAREGIFLDIGGYDGIRLSNSYALEQLGWRGVLVEANPRMAEACRRNRPLAIVEEAAIGGPDAGGEATFTMVEGDGADTLSFLNGDASHIARCEREGRGLQTVRVPLISIGNLLEKHDITRIDLLSIDIEGGEEEALGGLDFRKYSPRVVIVEANDTKRAAVLHAFFAARGYSSLRRMGVNLIFGPAIGGDSPA